MDRKEWQRVKELKDRTAQEILNLNLACQKIDSVIRELKAIHKALEVLLEGDASGPRLL